jgi:hypothetical protein
MPSTSIIWQLGLFRKISKNEAECVECSTTLKCPSGSTGGLINHVTGTHKNSIYAKKYLELLKTREGEKGALDKHININITGSGQHIQHVCHF